MRGYDGRIIPAEVTNGFFTYPLHRDGKDLTNHEIAQILFNTSLLSDKDNLLPVAASDTYSLVEDGQLIIPADGISANDADPEGNILTAVLVTPPY